MGGHCVPWAAACGAILALHAPLLAAGPPAATVKFAGEVAAHWEIEPRVRSVEVARGEVFANQITIRNKSGLDVVAMVVKAIRPPAAAGALIHLGCGPTFTVVLKPGESAAVPASYFVADDAPAEVSTFEIAYAVYSFESIGEEARRAQAHASSPHPRAQVPLRPAGR